MFNIKEEYTNVPKAPHNVNIKIILSFDCISVCKVLNRLCCRKKFYWLQIQNVTKVSWMTLILTLLCFWMIQCVWSIGILIKTKDWKFMNYEIPIWIVLLTNYIHWMDKTGTFSKECFFSNGFQNMKWK